VLAVLLCAQTLSGVCELRCDLGTEHTHCASTFSARAVTMVHVDHCGGKMAGAMSRLESRSSSGQCAHEEIVAAVDTKGSATPQVAHDLQIAVLLENRGAPTSHMLTPQARQRLSEAVLPDVRPSSVRNLRI